MKSFAKSRVGMMAVVGVLSCWFGICDVQQTAHAQSTAAASNQERGQAALAAGQAALEQFRWEEAARQFQLALSYLPDNEQAREGLHQAQIRQQEASTSQDVVAVREQQRTRAKVEFNESVKVANQRLAENDFSGASREILSAKVKLDQRSNYLLEGEYRTMSREAQELMDRIEQADRTAQAQAILDSQAAASQAKIDQDRRERQVRAEQINQSMLRVRQLQSELKYEEALQVLDGILFIDEHNPMAQIARAAITTTMQYRDYSSAREHREFGITELRIGGQRAMIPPHKNFSGPGDRSTSGVMTYPEDWPQLSYRRTGDAGFLDSQQNRQVWQKLQDTRVPVDFNKNTFEQVQTFLENVTGVPVYVDWKALNLVGIDRNDEITLKLQDVNSMTAVERVLEQLGDGDQRPQFDVQDGILTITSDEAMRKRVFLRVYDIRDLLFQVPTFDNAPELDLDAALAQGNTGGGGGGSSGGGGGGFGGGGSGGGGSGGGGSLFSGGGEDPDRPTREELVEQIVNIIQENIDPDGWRDLGGDTGSLQELNGNLIITNTAINHRGIEGLLAQLREIRALQINVESRFLTVANNWFEKIGIDLDLYFNTNSTMTNAAKNVDPNFHLSDFFRNDGSLKDPLVFGSVAQVFGDEPTEFNTVPSGALFGVPTDSDGDGILDTIVNAIGPTGAPIRNTGGWAPIGLNQNSASLVDQLADFDVGDFAGIASGNPAIAVGLQFLDDIQVDLLIEATQADKRSLVMTAPRLTFFNGQRAWVAVTTQIAFVSGLDAVAGDASGAFEPEVSRISDGFVLDVEGVISADRRYVTMTVIFDFAEFLGFRQSDAAEVTGAAGGSSGAGDDDGGTATQFTGFVELPTIRVSQVRTTVSVPDRGTVLLGGQRHVKEIEVETGVPVLSKIPFVNRFFTNRVTSKEEQSLLILIRPEIVIQQENEDLLFPGLGDSLGAGSASLR